MWLSGDGGFILERKSAEKIEKLLRDKKSFIELRKQKGVYVIPCEDPTSGPFPLIEKESDQKNQMDMSDVEDSEGQACEGEVCPSPPERQRERGARGHVCDVPQLVRGVHGRTRNRRRPKAFSEGIVGAFGGHGLRFPWSRH